MSEVVPIPISKGALGSLLSLQEWRGRMAFGPQQGLLSDTSARFSSFLRTTAHLPTHHLSDTYLAVSCLSVLASNGIADKSCGAP